MGGSSSCAIFEAFSSALEWLSKHLFHASSVVHILDDSSGMRSLKTVFETVSDWSVVKWSVLIGGEQISRD